VERFNGTFCTQLAKYHDENKENWDEYLQSVVYAYNTGIHATTGLVPYELAFGRRQKSPFDPSSIMPNIPNTTEFYKRLKKSRRTILQQARENIRHQQQSAKQRYDKHRKDIQYAVDDLVFTKVCSNRSKLDKRWTGPCRIISKTGEQHYQVQNDETGKTTWTHVSQLLPVVTRHI
jgi:hypothetical protein